MDLLLKDVEDIVYDYSLSCPTIIFSLCLFISKTESALNLTEFKII